VKPAVLVDCGPLVALIDRQDDFHAWARDRWNEVSPPLLTCESVISEACFLLRPVVGGTASVLDLLRRHVVQIAFRLPDEIASVERLLARYANVPMSLADACLVRMAELHAESALITLDADFNIYRKSGRQVIPTIMPTRR
jgi:predicted nucleic acid-binding protein